MSFFGLNLMLSCVRSKDAAGEEPFEFLEEAKW